MDAESYKVTCEKCGGSDVLKFVKNHNGLKTVFYKEHLPIISARFRPDLNWGFECMCGQDSRVAPEEKDSLGVLVQNASDSMIKAIAKSLTPKNELKFRMEPV